MSANWFLHRNGNEYGPYSWEQLQEYAREGRIGRNDLTKSDMMPEWVNASEVPGLFPPASSGTVAQMSYVGVGMRLVALIIDTAVFFLLGFIIALFTGDVTGDGYAMEGGPVFLMFFLGFLYYILLEGLLGATLGKMAIGITVRKMDGSISGIVSALVRNVLRVVDFLPFFYILGAILVWSSPRRQRLGDRVADTVVVKKASLQ